MTPDDGQPTERIEEFLRTERPDTPFVVIDLDVVRASYEQFVDALPEATVFYAVKANPARPILELLVGLNQREGMAVLLVSHQLVMVRETVRQVLWVSDGRVLHGDAHEMLKPENLDRLYAAGESDVAVKK